MLGCTDSHKSDGPRGGPPDERAVKESPTFSDAELTVLIDDQGPEREPCRQRR